MKLAQLTLVLAVATAAPAYAQNSIEVEGYGTLYGINIDDITVKSPALEIQYIRHNEDTRLTIEVHMESESMLDVNWSVKWTYLLDYSSTPGMEKVLVTDKLDPWDNSISYILGPGEVYYMRGYVTREIGDPHGDIRRDQSRYSGVYRLEGFDYSEMDTPPRHEGPVGRTGFSRKESEERAENGFVVIE